MFQLIREERDEVITICDDLKPLKFARTMPFAFTEHGVAMLSSVLNSERAIRVCRAMGVPVYEQSVWDEWR